MVNNYTFINNNIYNIINQGLLCADSNGLAITSKGDLSPAFSGRYASLARHASSLYPDQSPPTILIETNERRIIVKDYDSMTVVMSLNSM